MSYLPQTSPASLNPKSEGRGFTLIELMVSIGITAVMVSFILSITTNVLDRWNSATGRMGMENQASLILDLLTNDLRTAVIRRDGRVYLAATIQKDQTGSGDAGGVTDSSSGGGTTLNYVNWNAGDGGIAKPGKDSPGTSGSSLNLPVYQPPTSATQTLTASNLPELSTYRFGQAGVWLRLFSPVVDTNDTDVKNASVPRAVAYQIIRMKQTSQDDANNPPYRYFLFRSTVRPFHQSTTSQTKSTFSANYDFFYNFSPNSSNVLGAHLGGGSNVAIYNTPTAGGGGLSQDDASNIRRPNMQQLLATNVIDFGVRFWGRTYDSAGKPMLVLLFPSSLSPSSPNLGFAATTEDGFTRRNDAGSILPAIQPPSQSGWDGSGFMTYAFAYNKNGNSGAATPDTPCLPVVADIFLRILDDEGAQIINRIENPPEGVVITPPSGMSRDEYWWHTAEKHSQVFIRRVELYTNPI